jgi:hypothetical protein
MTDIYEGYLSPKERKEAIADAKLDNLFERCNMMYEMVQLQYEQNVREAELKVLTEGGTYDDLAFLIEEAGEEAADKKKGLISTLIDGIVSLFKQIGESIRKLFVKDGVEVEADEGIMSGVNTFDKMFGVIERTFSGGIVQAFLKGVGVVEGCKQAWNFFTSIPKASGVMKKYASNGVNKAKEILARICDWIAEKTEGDKSKVNEMPPEQVDEDKGEGWSIRRVLDWFKDIGKSVREHVNSLAKSLGDKLRGDDSGGDDTKKAIKDDIQYAKGGWFKGSDGKYTKDESKIPGSSAAYLDSEGYKSILTNAGVAEGDARKEYDEYVKQTFQDPNVGPKDPPQDNGGNTQNNNNNTQSTQDNNNNTQSTPSIKKKDGTDIGPRMLKRYNELKNAYDKKASGPHRAEAKALNDFIRQNNLDVPTVESELDDYIDELESTIYENSMSDYEYHSLVSAIDALF